MGLFDTKHPLGQKLVRKGTITSDQLRIALKDPRHKGRSLGAALVDLGFAEEQQILDQMAEIYELPVVGPEALKFDPESIALIPEELKGDHSVFPMKRAGKTLSVATSDPSDTHALKKLEKATGLKLRLVLAPRSAIRAASSQGAAINKLGAQRGSEDLGPFIPLFAQLPDYEVLRAIARGGFGTVFHCHQKSLDRPVAVKVLGEEWNRVAEVAERFKREGKIIASLDHPNIVRVYEQGERAGFLYIVMEFFEGTPMDRALAGKNLMTKLACMRSVSSALDYAHKLGIIHRDVKPSNILVGRLGQVKLLDFGIARVETLADDGLTRPQLVLGTPQYMAPELHISALNATPSSDVYAFGVMAYESLVESRFNLKEAKHPSHVDSRVPAELGNLVLRMLAHDAEQRPESFALICDVIQRAIDTLVFGEETSAKKPRAASASPSDTDPGRGPMREIDSRYEFLSILRDDSNCRTTLAQHKALNRRVIIKHRKKPMPSERLAAIMAVKGPHIAEIYGAGFRDGKVILVREFLEGETLAERMKHRMEPEEIAPCLRAAVDALRLAKQSNLAHGHLQPANVLFGEDGRIKVSDFGLLTDYSREFERYRVGAGAKGLLFGDRWALGVMTYELISCKQINPARPLEDLFAELIEDGAVCPTLRYFLGRLWQMKRFQPAFVSYDDMALDLERICNRLGASIESRRPVTPNRITPIGARAESPMGRTMNLMVSAETVQK